MDFFSVSVDLSSLFDDYRSTCMLLVDRSCMNKVKDVENHIKTIFDIQSDIGIFYQKHFLPSAEDSRILKGLEGIRVDTLLSAPRKQSENNNTPCEEQNELQNDGDVTKLKRKHYVTFVVGQDENFDAIPSSKKKKQKKKRTDDESIHDSSTSYCLPDSSPMTSSFNVQEIDKVQNSKKTKLTEFSVEDNSNGICNSNKKDTPNGTFYDKIQEAACVNAKQFIKEHLNRNEVSELNVNESSPAAKDGGTGSVINNTELLKINLNNDLSTGNSDSSPKPKKKRVRKRKRANQAGTVVQVTESAKPQSSNLPAPKQIKYSTPNGKHIYFSNDEQENEAVQRNAEELPIENHEEGRFQQKLDLKMGINSPKALSENADENTVKDNNGEKVSENYIENPALNVGPSATNKIVNLNEKNYHQRSASAGLGKLLSLVKSDCPPVFERQKIPKPTHPAIENPEISKLVSSVENPVKSTSSPQLAPSSTPPQIVSTFPADELCASSSNKGNNPIVTPLKSFPKTKDKITFKILKMSASYCPELSNPIIAVVEEVNEETQDLTLKIISGAEECQKPRGKFDLDSELNDPEEGSAPDSIHLRFQELIGPSVIV